MHGLASDLRYAFRTFAASKLVALSAVGTIAVSIGLVTATYTVVEAVLIRSLPFTEPQQLVIIKQTPLKSRTKGSGATSSALALETIRRDNRTLVDVAAHIGSTPILTGVGDPERIMTWSVSSNLYPLLGVQPLFGRGFREEDDRPGSAAVAVLSYEFWSSRFGADRHVLGRTIALDGRAVEIVGVMPKEIKYPAGAVLWSSLGWTLATQKPATAAGPQGGYWITLFIDKIETMQAKRSASIGRQRFFAALLSTFAISTLLLAAAGIFALMMFAISRRTREIGIRMALGAERADVLALVLGRVSIVMIVGIVVGLLGSAMVTRGLEALLFGVKATDPVVFGLCAALIAGVGVIASLVPAYRAASIDPRVAIASE